jgi:hypothetical protein
MRTVEAYQSADGVLHLCEKDAKARDDDLLGEALDGLFLMFELDVSRSQQYKAIMCLMKKRKALAQSIAEIAKVLAHVEQTGD